MGWKVAVYTNPQSIKVRYRWILVTPAYHISERGIDLQTFKEKNQFSSLSTAQNTLVFTNIGIGCRALLKIKVPNVENCIN
jgi:hypothetical protein